MSFLILACLLTVLSVAAVAVPLWRGPGRVADNLAHDREMYRQRLEEIDADLQLGRIDREAAEAARAEEARKLLYLARENETGRKSSHWVGARPVILAAVAFVPVMAALFYFSYGAPQMPDMAIADRPDRDLSAQSLAQLLERAEARLASHPEDLRGWTVVAPVYLRMGRVADSITAWRNAVRLDPDNVELKASLAEALVVGASGVVTEEALDLFEQVLEATPGAAKPRFYKAIALGQQGEWEKARTAWESLIGEAPSDAPWLAAARAQLRQARTNLGEEPASSGPGTEEIEAASRLSAEERAQMIRGMVDGLADRLAENPDDRDGWRRLVRSYTVLGETESMRAALERAQSHFESDPAFLEELRQIAGVELDRQETK